MKIYSIGFTKKSAREFMTMLKNSGVKRIIDIRINNLSQLAGFTKKDDLEYFLKEICNVDYIHISDLAPTADMLKRYRKKELDWAGYESEFMELMQKREVEKRMEKEIISDGCLLCSEDKPYHCHRRLVAEYLQKNWGDVEIIHL